MMLSLGSDRGKKSWRRIGTTALLTVLVAAGCSASGESWPTISGVTPEGVYFESGGSGHPIVLIHGFSLDRRMWEPQLAALLEGHRVIRYDLRGHGASTGPTGPFAAYDDLAAVLDALEVDRASLVGLSAGAQVAIDFALTYPDRVDKLVVASPGLSGYVPRAPFTWFQPVADALASGDVDLAASRWAETPLLTVSDSAVASMVTRIVRDNARIWSYQRGDQPPDPPAVARLADLTVPMLVIVGERDLPNIHGVVDTLMTCVVTAQRLTIPGARHMVNLSAVEAFNRAVVSFLDGHGGGPSQTVRSPCA